MPMLGSAEVVLEPKDFEPEEPLANTEEDTDDGEGSLCPS